MLMLFSNTGAAARTSRPAAELTLPETAEISGSRIFLGALAGIRTDDPVFRARLNETDLGASPAPGAVIFLPADTIRLKLKRAGVDEARVRMSGAKRISVSRRTVHLSRKRMKAWISAEIQRRIAMLGASGVPSENGNEEIRVMRVTIPRSVEYPDREPDTRILEMPDLRRAAGLVNIRLHLSDESGGSLLVPGTVRIARRGMVVVTVRPLARMQPLSPRDLALKNVDLATAPDAAYRRMKSLSGLRALRAIAPNTILTPALVDEPPLVRRGDIVQMVARSPLFRISTRGRVKKDGRRGEQVAVKNLRSGKQVYGRVVDAGTVEVDY